jgi:hypothetical protein
VNAGDDRSSVNVEGRSVRCLLQCEVRHSENPSLAIEGRMSRHRFLHLHRVRDLPVDDLDLYL